MSHPINMFSAGFCFAFTIVNAFEGRSWPTFACLSCVLANVLVIAYL